MITLHPGEHIVLAERRFWLPIALQSAALVLLAAAPFVLVFLAEEFLAEPWQQFVQSYRLYGVFFAAAWALVVWIIFFIRWTDYYLDVLLVTNERVIDVEQVGLFVRDIAEARLDCVQDIRIEVVGLLASLMDFGNMYVQTAGSAKEFAIKNISHPGAVKDAISRQCNLLASASSGAKHPAAPP